MGLTWRPGGRGSADFYDAVAVQPRNANLTEFTLRSPKRIGVLDGAQLREFKVDHKCQRRIPYIFWALCLGVRQNPSEPYQFHNLG